MIIDENQACFGEKVQIWYAISMHWSHFYTKWWCFRLYNATPWLFVSSSSDSRWHPCSRIPKSDVRKAKKDSSNANKKDVRTITQSEEQEKLLSDLLGGIRDGQTVWLLLIRVKTISNIYNFRLFSLSLQWPYRYCHPRRQWLTYRGVGRIWSMVKRLK